MKLAFFLALGGIVALAGCSTQAASPTPTTVPPTPAATTPPHQPTAAPTAAPAGTPGLVSSALAGSAFQKGKQYMLQRNYRAAEAQFKIAVSGHYQLAQSYAALGTSALQLGDFPTAYQAYRSAAALTPNNAEVIYYTGYSALHASDFHAALTYATRYTTMQPKDANGYHLRLLAHGHLYMKDQQIGDARAIVRLQPRNPDAYNDLDIALGNNSRYPASIAAFTQAIRLDGSNASYYINRAVVENLNKQPTLALNDLYAARARAARYPAEQKQIDLAIANLKKHLQH